MMGSTKGRHMKQLAVLAMFLGLPAAWADSACETRLNDSKMMVHPEDARIMCERGMSQASQECLVETLKMTKGKLRGKDLFEVYGLCSADPSQEMRDCLFRGLDKPWNDPGYKGALSVGNACMKMLADQKLKAQREAAWGEATAAAAAQASLKAMPQRGKSAPRKK